MNLKHSIIKITISLILGGIFYFAWMGVFILTVDSKSSAINIIRWLTGPVITAVGFAVGIKLFEHFTKRNGPKFYRIFLWSLVGCGIGAGSVYWYGPMLIVFGMFVVGTASMVLREIALRMKDGKK